ncbi:MAG: metallophosphatase [Flavobacteriia bacterium]|nr:metallophosphatase [Flavobacteriia bacterium]
MLRRSFIKKSLLSSSACLVAPTLLSFNQKKTVHLTILHTNDTHSHIDPFPVNDPKYPGKGGVVKRYEFIKEVRNEKKNVLLLDAGDMFQGTPFFNKYGGELEIKLMSQMGYDASCIGNHEFDGGLNGLKKALSFANFPLICANYDFSKTEMNGLSIPHKIFEFEGIKVGVFGLGVQLKNLVPDKLFLETQFLDPIEIAKEQVKILQQKKCAFIICLSHLGYEYKDDKISDKVLANKTKGIDLIIGGHTHTFLHEPTLITNLENKTTAITQVGWAGVQLGRIDVILEKKMFLKNQSIEII